MKWLWPIVLAILLAAVIPVGADDGDPLALGLDAYGNGHFADAAVILKRAPESSGKDPGLANYLQGRSYQELGLRGLALHYLGRAEEAEAWRVPALREIARSYLAVGEYPAALEAFGRLGTGREDGELRYLGGVAAAGLERWQDAISILEGIPPDEPRYAVGRYVAAQAKAAREDFEGALAILRALVADRSQPLALRDQARLLSGKILFVQGRTAEAHRAFADVESRGSAGAEALRGLVLTGAGAETAARATVSEKRPLDRATLLLVRAVAAEERDAGSRATVLREELREVIESRIREIEAVERRGRVADALVDDLGRFAGLLRHERWRERFEREIPELERYEGAPDLTAGAPADRFEPSQALFYDAWKRVRLDPTLRGAVELLSRCDELLASTRGMGATRSFWMFWKREDDHLFVLALAALRASDLERLWVDHMHTVGELSRGDARERKDRVARVTRDALRKLYLGDSAIPEPLSTMNLHFEYKQHDMDRLIQRLPDQSTEPVTSLLGNWIDLLEDTRRRWEELPGELVPDDPLPETAAPEAFAGDVRRNVEKLRSEISRLVADVVTPTLRRQQAILTRLAADNEGSLSRLYARRQGALEATE